MMMLLCHCSIPCKGTDKLIYTIQFGHTDNAIIKKLLSNLSVIILNEKFLQSGAKCVETLLATINTPPWFDSMKVKRHISTPSPSNRLIVYKNLKCLAFCFCERTTLKHGRDSIELGCVFHRFCVFFIGFLIITKFV